MGSAMSWIVGIAIYFIKIEPLGPEICPFLTWKTAKNDVSDVGALWSQPLTSGTISRWSLRHDPLLATSGDLHDVRITWKWSLTSGAGCMATRMMGGSNKFYRSCEKKETQKLVPKTEGLFYKIILVWFISWEFSIRRCKFDAYLFETKGDLIPWEPCQSDQCALA